MYKAIFSSRTCILAIVSVLFVFTACQNESGNYPGQKLQSLQKLNEPRLYKNTDSVLIQANSYLSDPNLLAYANTATKINAYQIKTKVFSQQNIKDSMVYFANESCRLAATMLDTQQIVNSLQFLSYDEFSQVHTRIIEKWINIAIVYLQRRAPTEQHAYIYNTHGSLLSRDDKHPEALKWLLNSYNIYKKYDYRQALGAVCVNIGNVYSAIQSYDEALKYQRLAANYMRQSGDTQQLAAVLSNIGILYKRSKPDSAVYYFQYVIDSLTSENNLPAKYNLANVFADVLGRTDEALALYQDVKKSCEDTHIPQGVLYAKTGIGNVLIKKGRYTEALAIYREAEKEANSLGYPEISNNIKENIILAYEKQGNFQGAFELLRSLETYKDSVLNLETRLAVHDLELFYQTENQRLENQNLLAQIENQKLITRYRLLIISLVIVILLTSIFSVVRKNRIKAKQLRELEEKYHLLAEIERVKSEQAEFLEKIVSQQQDELISIAKENELIRTEFADKPILPLPNADDESPEFAGNKTYWQNLSIKFDLIYPGFVENLKKNYPRLTQNDVQFCMLIKLNIPLKDIASIFNITMPGIYKKKYRLEEKLNLKENDDSLQQFIAQL